MSDVTLLTPLITRFILLKYIHLKNAVVTYQGITYPLVSGLFATVQQGWKYSKNIVLDNSFSFVKFNVGD